MYFSMLVNTSNYETKCNLKSVKKRLLKLLFQMYFNFTLLTDVHSVKK